MSMQRAITLVLLFYVWNAVGERCDAKESSFDLPVVENGSMVDRAKTKSTNGAPLKFIESNEPKTAEASESKAELCRIQKLMSALIPRSEDIKFVSTKLDDSVVNHLLNVSVFSSLVLNGQVASQPYDYLPVKNGASKNPKIGGLSKTEQIMLNSMIRRSVDTLVSAYREFVRAKVNETTARIQEDGASTAAERLKIARERLTELVGEKAIKDLDIDLNSEITKSSAEKTEISPALERERKRIEILWDAALAHSPDINFVLQKLGLQNGKELANLLLRANFENHIMMIADPSMGDTDYVSVRSVKHDPTYTPMMEREPHVAPKKRQKLSSTEQIQLTSLVRFTAEGLIARYSEYIKLRAAHSVQSESFDKAKLDTVRKKLVEIVGEKAVDDLDAELDSQSK